MGVNNNNERNKMNQLNGAHFGGAGGVSSQAIKQPEPGLNTQLAATYELLLHRANKLERIVNAIGRCEETAPMPMFLAYPQRMKLVLEHIEKLLCELETKLF